MVKAAIYYRAFLQEADVQDQALERRRQLCLSYADTHEYTVDDRLYAESINPVGVERVGLQNLWLLISNRTIDALLVPNLTHLSTIPAQLVGCLRR